MYKVFSSQSKWLSLIFSFFLIFTLVISVFPIGVLADEGQERFHSPYEVIITDESGNQIILDSFPLPPQRTRAAAATVPDVHIAGAINSLENTPALEWSYGCSATAAAMLFGYYDRTGYSNMYAGPTNGGVFPLPSSAIWGETFYDGTPYGQESVTCMECPLSATHNGIDGRAIRGHVDDYWIAYGEDGPDPWVSHWPEHTLGDCTGDYMGTNQWKYGSPVAYNYDGGTLFYLPPTGDPAYDYTGDEPTIREGCHGMRLFAESRGYTVVTNFSQRIQGWGSDPTKGFTFADFQAEIDAGRPVLIQVTGHSMLGYGYNTTGNIIYIHNTWNYDNDTMTWGGTYSANNLQHYAVTVIRLAAPPTTPPTVTNSTGASDITSTSAKLNGEVTATGGEDPTVHIYWGDNDGGTGTWDHDVNLGTKGIGTFSTDIFNLSSGTTYYYRCYATNSAGGAWATSTTSFNTLAPGAMEKLVGADDTACDKSIGYNYFVLSRFQAVGTADVVTFKLKASDTGNVKVAIYSDNSGQPGSLLSAVNTTTAVVAGWNDITITSTPVVSGNYYWLGFNSDSQRVCLHFGSGITKFRPATYGSFTFPSSAGSFTRSVSSWYPLIAGWGTAAAPTAPTVTNSTGESNVTYNSARLNGEVTDTGNENPTVTIHWGPTDGGTTPGSWTNSEALGTKGAEAFYTDISGLTHSTTYYYRCYATNSAGEDWADTTEDFITPPAPTAPTVTNSSGESNVTSDSARLNGEVTATGNEDPSVTIYWGATDGGTTPGSWANSEDLGTKGAETFYTDISGLTPSTTYYYRCHASNSAGADWADTTKSFTTLSGPQKLVGADDTACDKSIGYNYFVLSRFQAVGTADVVTFKLKASDTGNVKVAIYSDNSGQPGSLLSAVNTTTAVVAGWNDITITSTPVVSGNYYWLGFNSDSQRVCLHFGSGITKFRPATYGSFTFPSSAGSFTRSVSSWYPLIAGWGTAAAPTAPTVTNSTGESNVTYNSARLNGEVTDTGNENPTVTIHWGPTDGGTTPGSWTNSEALGTKGAEAFYTDISGLTHSTTYYYRCYATNSAGEDWADTTEDFITPGPPDPPTLVSPGAAITFGWSAPSGATKYWLQVNTNSSFTGTSMFDMELGNVTSQEVTGFSIGTTYYWRVKAGNDIGWSSWSSVRSVVVNDVP